MNDSQIHQAIERLVAEERELWQRESAGIPGKAIAGAWTSSRSRSTRAGICSASDARCAKPVSIRTPPRHDHPTWWSGTSSSGLAATAPPDWTIKAQAPPLAGRIIMFDSDGVKPRRRLSERAA